MADSKTRALSRVPLFSQLSRSELEFVASRADEVSAKAGHTLITQGRAGDSFYVLLDGEAHVDVKGKPRRTLKSGDFFGEISMLDRGLASATVTQKVRINHPGRPLMQTASLAERNFALGCEPRDRSWDCRYTVNP